MAVAVEQHRKVALINSYFLPHGIAMQNYTSNLIIIMTKSECGYVEVYEDIV